MAKRIVPTILAASIILYSGFAAKAVESIATDNLQSTVASLSETANYSVGSEVKVSENGKTASCVISINEDGEYAFEVVYSIAESVDSDLECSVLIDGVSCIDDAVIKPYWQDSGDSVRTDLYGDEYAPEQVRFCDNVTAILRNEKSPLREIYYLKLSKGLHTVSFNNISDNITISKLLVTKKRNIEKYDSEISAYESEKYNLSSVNQFAVQGESAYIKSEKSLVAKSDSSSARLTPSNPYKQKINYIGGVNWKTPGEEIVWKVNIPETGYYKLGFSFLQDQNINGYSYRELKIDNEIPYSECESLSFGYSTGWQNKVLTADENEMLFYFTSGEHLLSLTCTLGETAEQYKALQSVLTEIGDLYIDITMITGESPDANRDYELFKNIPNFNDKLEGISESLGNIANSLQKLSNNETTSLISSIRDMKRIADNMVKEKYSAQNYVSNYQSSYTTLCNWLYDMRSMPLSIDEIIVIPSEKDAEFKTVGFGEKLGFGIKRFISAFSDDYIADDGKNSNSIKIWVNWGRDQTMVLNNLISGSFTPKTGIKVNLEITDASLLYGMMSGIAPDLALQMARTEPVNLALRGALVDLSKFDDYNSVITRFGDSADIPYRYNGGVYALPDTQSFQIMFYRKDILNNLGISVPNTWDDFLAATSVLQRNNMNAWIPYTQISSASTVNTGVGGLNMYASILQQFGGSIYNADLDECVINDSIGLNAFTYWTDMYSKFTLPTTASFYNRFRIGTMPLGIEAYTLYTTLVEAAPDIDRRWGIALVPGIADSSGNINRSVAGSGTGCAILKSSKNQTAAWEFLKWWTSAETQTAYNNNVEAILGTISRITTSNVEAFSKMDWNDNDLSILLEQRSNIREIPEVPGSYYVSRSVDQAFWNVINNSVRPKDAVDKWSKIATEEIKRKISEYSK